MSNQKHLFCFGYGYSCDYLGHLLAGSGEDWRIAGTTRDEDKFAQMSERGIAPFMFDYDQPLSDPAGALERVTHLLVSTPPDDEGDPAFLLHAQDILRVCKNLEWVGYLSTTGVYGNTDGEWIDESAPLQATSRRGIKRAKAEEQWLSLHRSSGLPVHILRLSGIYGPGRSALDSVRAGIARRIDKPGQVFGRIHVEDIAQAIKASMDHPMPGAIYNVIDNEPAPSHEVIAHACQLLGFAEPPLIPIEEADLSPMAQSFYDDNRRVKNEKLKNELGVALKYPTYREGLQGCLEAEQYATSQIAAQSRSPFSA